MPLSLQQFQSACCSQKLFFIYKKQIILFLIIGKVGLNKIFLIIHNHIKRRRYLSDWRRTMARHRSDTGITENTENIGYEVVKSYTTFDSWREEQQWIGKMIFIETICGKIFFKARHQPASVTFAFHEKRTPIPVRRPDIIIFFPVLRWNPSPDKQMPDPAVLRLQFIILYFPQFTVLI